VRLAVIAATPTAAEVRNNDRRDSIDDFTFSMMQALHMVDVSSVAIAVERPKVRPELLWHQENCSGR
jgi:hypothetical protein